jgi:predicted Fe-Mo cluster-binding NifX family protein
MGDLFPLLFTAGQTCKGLTKNEISVFNNNLNVLKMKKISIPITQSNDVDEHFGHSQFFGVYTISEANEIVDIKTIPSSEGCGCRSNIAGVLAGEGVTIMLAGGIGGGAINVLNNFGIQVIRGCTGNATELAHQFIEGKISDSGESCASHEHHHHGSGHDHDIHLS